MDIKKPALLSSKSGIPHDYNLVEAFDSSVEELFFIENLHVKKDTPLSHDEIKEFKKKLNIQEIWISFPWHKVAVHTVSEDLYFKLRTSRNRDLITEEEQLNYRKATVGIAGLSVGSVVLSALVMSGGPKSIKIADPDVVEITNLNRMKAGLGDVGGNKTHVAARETWDLDPFADLHLWDKGLSRNNLKEFVLGKPPLDVFIDEMDSLDLKISSRLICKESKMPVLMATDLGDEVMLDIERYDLEPKRPIFHGLLGEVNVEDYKKTDYKAWLKLSTKIIGPEYLPIRLRDSLSNIGKSIPAVPQLGTTALIAGAAVAYAVRRIANGQDMPSGRYMVSLDEALSFKNLAFKNIDESIDKIDKIFK